MEWVRQVGRMKKDTAQEGTYYQQREKGGKKKNLLNRWYCRRERVRKGMCEGLPGERWIKQEYLEERD